MLLEWDGQDAMLAHVKLCERIQERALADGWEIEGPRARIIFTGAGDTGFYTVVVGPATAQMSGPIPVEAATEDHLYSIYQRLLAVTGVRRSQP